MSFFIKKIFKRLKILLILVMIPTCGFVANDVEKYHEKAETLLKKIEISQEQIEDLLNEETAVLGLIEQIDMRLDALKKQISVYSSELSELDTELQLTEARSHQLKKKVDSKREYAGHRLVAIYKMNRLDTLSMIASAESFSDFLFQKKALERVFVHDKQTVRNLIEKQAELENLQAEIKMQKQKKLVLDEKLKTEKALMSLERKKRSLILTEIRNKKTLELELIEAYRQAAVILNETIAAFRNEEDNQKIGKFVSDKPFDTFKGLLNMPVNGKITARFGAYKDKKLNVKRFNSGIFLRTDRGEPVQAVQKGRILFAGWFKGYGKMIIIDHGHQYYTVYAHAEELFKDKGDLVESGEVIATVGDSGSVSGPELYFEVRHHGKPVDPLEWIKKG